MAENYNGIIVNKNSTYMQFAEKLEGILERPNTLSFLMNNSRKSAYFFNEIKILKSVREFL